MVGAAVGVGTTVGAAAGVQVGAMADPIAGAAIGAISTAIIKGGIAAASGGPTPRAQPNHGRRLDLRRPYCFACCLDLSKSKLSISQR